MGMHFNAKLRIFILAIFGFLILPSTAAAQWFLPCPHRWLMGGSATIRAETKDGKADYIQRNDIPWDQGRTRRYTDCGVFVSECARTTYDSGVPDHGSGRIEGYLEDSEKWEEVPLTDEYIEGGGHPGDIIVFGPPPGRRTGHVAIIGFDGDLLNASLGGFPPRSEGPVNEPRASRQIKKWIRKGARVFRAVCAI